MESKSRIPIQEVLKYSQYVSYPSSTTCSSWKLNVYAQIPECILQVGSCLPKFDFGIQNLWNILFQKFDMFLLTSVFQNQLVHTDFDMFVDE